MKMGNDYEKKDGSADNERGDNVCDKIIFMNFFAGWCSSSQSQGPIIEELKMKYGDKIEFRKIDVDDETTSNGSHLLDKYNVREIPTLIIEKDGKVLARFVGMTNIFILDKKIRELIGKRRYSRD